MYCPREGHMIEIRKWKTRIGGLVPVAQVILMAGILSEDIN